MKQMPFFKNTLFLLLFLVSLFLNGLNFYVIVKSGILDFPDMIKLNLQELTDFVGSVGAKLENFELRLGDLEKKIDSNIKSPPEDIILPVLTDEKPKIEPYDDAQFYIDCAGFGVGVILCIVYKLWNM